MNIGVIGSGGFLSKNLVDNLDYSTLTIYGRTDVNKPKRAVFKRFDILKAENKNFQDFLSHDVLIICAAMGVQSGVIDSVEDVLHVNYLYPVKLFDYLEKKGYNGKIITFGSYFEIGLNGQYQLISEEDIVSMRTQAPNVYCVSKRNLTQYLMTINTNLNTFHLILPTIYGVGEYGNRLIPYLVSSLKSNRDIILTSGEQIRQYLYILDLVGVIQKYILKGELKKGVYNLGGDIVKVKELVNLIQSYFLNSKSRISFDKIIRLDSQMNYLGLNDKKLTEQIGQYRNVSIFRDLERIINEYAV